MWPWAFSYSFHLKFCCNFCCGFHFYYITPTIHLSHKQFLHVSNHYLKNLPQTRNWHNRNLSPCQKGHTYLLTTAGHSPAYSTFNSKLGSSLSTLWRRASKEITTASAVLSRSLVRKCDNVVLVWVELLFGESLWIIVVVPDAVRFWALGPNMGNTVNNQKWYFSQHMHNFPSLITVTSVFKISAILDCLMQPGGWGKNTARKSWMMNANHIMIV